MALLDVLDALVRHEVDFIVVDGLAAVLHGTPVNTLDVDVALANMRARAPGSGGSPAHDTSLPYNPSWRQQ